MARIQLAAGAKSVHSLHYEPVVLESEKDLGKLDDAPWEALKVRVVSAHLMGGCTMGKDPAKSVVDPHFRFHGLDNLFVVDGSVFPTALGVNPQLTIMALATRLAYSLLGKPAPHDEPEPDGYARPLITRPHALTA
jgi:choline dehydrogenase-like flavoprotein